MNINHKSESTFKGYDARPLRGFLMSSNCMGIADEMSDIGKREGFKIFSAEGYNCKEGIPHYQDMRKAINIWAQDYWTILKDSIVSLKEDCLYYNIKAFFNKEDNVIQRKFRSTDEYNNSLYSIYKEVPHNKLSIHKLDNLGSNTHIKGGNMFIVKGNLKDELIIGENELQKFSLEDIKEMYSVDKVCVLPQMDYHLDLFIRPLDNKRILLADDKETLKVLEKIKSSTNNEKWQKEYAEFIQNSKNNTFPSADEVGQKLEDSGYEVIKVPGRLYYAHQSDNNTIGITHKVNYLNANVIKNKNGDIVYITNKYQFDGLDENNENIFENFFVDYISPYVKKEHIYFIRGKDDTLADMLFMYKGGIHCAASEIPY